jgi:hypothetical protein
VTWQQPWAFVGLLMVAVPVIIHFLGRRSARIRRFPTLRFVGASRLMATRWTRVSDLAVLAVRAGIVVAAVAALAHPLLHTRDRQADSTRTIARGIIVDTSASMDRRAMPRATGLSEERVIDRARAEATRSGAEATTNVIVQTASVPEVIPGVVAWLGAQPGRRELVVISDFQRGMLDSIDLASIPADIGIDLVRIEAAASAAPVEMRTTQRDGEVIASIVTDSTRTVVEWQPAPTVGRDESPVALLAGERERQALEAASAAARSIGSLAVRADTGHRVAIVYPSYPQRDAMLGGAQAPSLAWQGELLVRLRGDSLLQSAAWAAADSNLAAPGGDPARTFVVARDRHGRPTVLAASDATAASPRLLLFPAGDAGSLVSAALITAATRAASVAADVGELERETIAEQTLANWRRAAASSPAAMDAGDGRSDGRWLWAVALVLLGVEGWIRRERRPGRVEEVVRERAA